MESAIPYIPATTVEATVSSKGQVTLPKALRDHLGIQTGSRIRFSLAPNGGFQASHVLYELEDIWKIADQGLGGHLKTGHLWSLQNRPLWMA